MFIDIGAGKIVHQMNVFRTEELVVRNLHYALEINHLWVLSFYAKMNHFEGHLMVSSETVDSKVLRMAILFEYMASKI